MALLGACGRSSRSGDGDDDDAEGGGAAEGASGGVSGKGGAPGTGGTGGTGATTGGTGGSMTSNHYVSEIRTTTVDKVDLLFMIDNSLSMASKQQLLADAIPVLVRRLTTPACVDELGNPVGSSAEGGACPVGVPEFAPIRNLHVGVITSSLGDHGSNDVCSEAQNQANQDNGGTHSYYNDLAQLLPSVRPAANLPSFGNSGFLVWDPRAAASDLHPDRTEHETDVSVFVEDVTAHVVGTGESGCGYEASLEAWYRFLVDPEPVTTLTNDGSLALRNAVNEVVLSQRAAFLRPDSLLTIVMLTDENDCSIIDEEGTQGWLVPYKGGVRSLNWHMPRASSGCQNANDACCRPCSAPSSSGCPNNAEDPVCSAGETLLLEEDSMNLRCIRQVQRFGIDLLYPTGRYVEALVSSFITPRLGGAQVPNPLFTGGREPGLVVFGGILGVPWQDLATAESLEHPRALELLSASELTAEGRWDIMLGSPSAGVAPLDTLMVESVDPRTDSGSPQVHPLLGVSLGAATASTLTNPINGHELIPTAARDQLQYACIFPLSEPLPCSDENSTLCACNSDEAEQNSPVCTGTSEQADGVQTHAKAYPGLRQLEVLQGVGDTGVVGSICAKNVVAEGDGPEADPNYGYNPFVRALLARMKTAWQPKCFPRDLTPSEEDPQQIACGILEARPAGQGCDCAALGRSEVPSDSATAVSEYMQEAGLCGQTGAPGCDEYCLCAIEQLSGDALDSCQAGEQESSAGFCFIAPERGLGSEEAVASCPIGQKRRLRFTGDEVPAKGAMTFIDCRP